MIISLPISKSIANRLLILGRDVTQGIPALDIPNDVLIVRNAIRQLSDCSSQLQTLNLHDCGTAVRFLTAYCAAILCEVIITGTERMKQRPIAPLVDALLQLGANIKYTETKNCLPIYIKGTQLKGGTVRIHGNISSQFISALMLISCQTENGIQIDILPPIVSSPYIEMTKKIIENPNLPLERDWSSAVFWYEYVALGGTDEILLLDLHPDSVQGDMQVVQIFRNLGVETIFVDAGVLIRRKTQAHIMPVLSVDFTNIPDLYPSIVATCFALKISTHFTGLDTLQYKESNRLRAMDEALMALSALRDSQQLASLNTYNDHRIAMAIAMLKPMYPNLKINNPECVSKSYPRFWQQYSQL